MLTISHNPLFISKEPGVSRRQDDIAYSSI